MPTNATQIAGADRIVPAAGLAATLVDLVRAPHPRGRAPPWTPWIKCLKSSART